MKLSTLSALDKGDLGLTLKPTFLCFCSSLLLLLFFPGCLHFDFPNNSTLLLSYSPAFFLLCPILCAYQLSALSSPTWSWSLLWGTTLRDVIRRENYVFVMTAGSHLFCKCYVCLMSHQDHHHIYVGFFFGQFCLCVRTRLVQSLEDVIKPP